LVLGLELLDGNIEKKETCDPCPRVTIAVCAKVWNRANFKIFASSEVKTCAASTAMTNHLISIIFVVLESPRWY
jgi:hypothetical protein